MGRITSTLPSYLTVGVTGVCNTWNEMENICRKSERYAMGIAPLLLCSEGRIAAQQSHGDPPALSAWYLLAPGLNVETWDHPVASTLHLLQEIKRTKLSSHTASTVRSHFPPITYARCFWRVRSDVLWQKHQYRNEPPRYMCARTYQCQRSKEKPTESKKIWKRNSNGNMI